MTETHSAAALRPISVVNRMMGIRFEGFETAAPSRERDDR